MINNNGFLYNVLDRYTGEQVSYTKVTLHITGVSMDDSKCDGVIYRKFNGEYFKRNFDILKPDNAVSYTHLDVYKRQLLNIK